MQALRTSLVVAGCLCVAAPSLAAAPMSAAAACVSDLRDFDQHIEKDGYWLSGSGYGYGYGYGYPMADYPVNVTGYHNSRPAHEVRVLLEAANVLARQGNQQGCEDILASTRVIYQAYVARLQQDQTQHVDLPNWRQRQIAAAQPLNANDAWFRSDELIGTEVRDPKGDGLGSITDLVFAPPSGKVAYLLIGRGGLFGFDEKYIPVPWSDFKISPSHDMLVLDTSKAVLEAAPSGDRDQFAQPAQFREQSAKVDAYWKTKISLSSTP